MKNQAHDPEWHLRDPRHAQVDGAVRRLQKVGIPAGRSSEVIRRAPRPTPDASRNRKLEIQRTAAPLLCSCNFVRDFAVAIEELNNRHAIGVDAEDEAIAAVGILDT